MAAKRIYGIDLGTTYSCIAYVDDIGKPVVLQNSDSELTTPSVVYFESSDNRVVGKEAKNSSKVFPDRVVSFVKRSMGSPDWSFEVDGVAYRPEEISSFILRKLVGDASNAVEESITDVVITCPAYFGINEREATKNAGKLAGLTVHHILNEPTAAAICYGVDKAQADQVVLVYDLGGGTFDITVIAIKGGDIQVICTGGNHSLGGKDWDDRLINYLAEQFIAQFPDKGDPRDDPYSFQAVANAAEEAKKGLSSKEKSPQMVVHGGERARVELTRQTLEEITNDLLEQTVELTRQVLEEAKSRGYPKIDQFLLVGGSSKMPCVARRLKETFGGEPQLFDPDLAVAKGAALMGLRIMAGELIKEEIAAQQGTTTDQVDLDAVDAHTIEAAAQKAAAKGGGGFRLAGKQFAAMATGKIINVCSHGFGIVVTTDEATREQKVVHLIHNNTPVPVEITEMGFGTLVPNQQSVSIEVMEQLGQCESPDLNNNVRISQGEITPLSPNLPAGSPIHVTFKLEADGTLFVSALEPSSGRNLNMDVKVQSIMSREEVEQRTGILLKQTVS